MARSAALHEPSYAPTASFFARVVKRAKRWAVPVVLLDVVVAYCFWLHLSFAAAANSALSASDALHARDPRFSTFISDAEALLGRSLLALLLAAAGTALCISLTALICWSARCLRERRRLAADISATLCAERDAAAVRIVDISTSGCRIECDRTLTPGMAVSLTFPDSLAVTARVVWQKELHAGLHFSVPLDERARIARAA